jgi:hypothetical protein
VAAARSVRFALLVSAALTLVAPLAAQEPTEPGSELTVYLMTMGPGELVYERFGHNAIWIRDHARGTDWTYNYGIFDFQQPNFIGRFVRGRMLYSMAPFDAGATADAYIRDDRSVWVQELALTPAQRVELRDFLEWNARPENRDYRYDYFYDNCSTRVRDVLDLALGGRLRQAFGGQTTGRTLRWHARRLIAADPVMYVLIQAGLSRRVDRPVDVWAEAYIPMRLQEEVRGLQVPDGAGGFVPLVRSEQALHLSRTFDEPPEPPRWTGWFLLAGLIIGGAFAATGHAGVRSRAGRTGYSLLAALWCGVAGLIGVILAFLWLATDHVAAHVNENLLQLNPLLLAGAVLLPALAFRTRAGVRWGHPLALTVLALSVVGLLLQLLPGSQANGEFLALVLPVHAGLAWGAVQLARSRPEPRARG